MLVGPPGVGKTALASVVAQEMATDFHDVLGQSIKGISDLNALLLAANDKDVIHIDEAHELDKRLQTALYLAIDRKKVLGAWRRQRASSQRIDDWRLHAATVHDRRVLFVAASSRSDAAGAAIRVLLGGRVDDRAQASNEGAGVECRGWSVAAHRSAFSRHASLGTATASICRRVARSEGESTITLAHLERACVLEQLDDLGLGPTEQKYLRLLADGATRLNVVASVLGLPARTVSHVTEPFLIRAGLVVKDDLGTAAADRQRA